MTEFLLTWWPVLLAYVIGATPFGFLAGKIKGIDVRQHGSGNIGATNVMRTLGKPIGITVLALDVCKGLVPVLIAKLATDFSPVHIAAAIATILGHNYTFWLGFKGGKGIATTAGAMAPIMPIALVTSLSSWIIVRKTNGYVSVASIVAALVIPITIVARAFITGSWDWYIVGFSLFVCILAIWKHRANIARLRAGTEPNAKKKTAPAETA